MVRDNPHGKETTRLPFPKKKSGRDRRLRRLDSLAKKLEKSGYLERDKEVIKAQFQKGIVGRAEEIPKGR